MAKKPGRGYPAIAVNHRVWRVLSPIWAHAPLGGGGAAVNGGRFNRPGTDTLYMSFDLMTAIVEYQQEFGSRPGTFCAYNTRIQPIVDLTDDTALKALKVKTADLDCPWKEIAWIDNHDPPTWRLADRLINDRIAGIKVPSFQNRTGINLVLWKWGDVKTRRLSVVDPKDELPKDRGPRR